MTLKHKIKQIMSGDGYKNNSPLIIILWLLSFLYGNIVTLRNFIYSLGFIKAKQLPCIVVSVGNITIGGTGKTPMTIYVAKLLHKFGYNVAVISRGYKGKAENTGGVVSDKNKLLMNVNEAGDEPIMMAIRLKNIPVLVGKGRFEIGMLAHKKFDSNLIVLDDAFQHLKLKRDIDIVLLDSARPLGNLHILPRGVMREPVSGLKRGDIYIQTRDDQKTTSSPNHLKELSNFILKEKIGDKPIFKAFHKPYCFKVKKETLFPIEKVAKGTVLNNFAFLKQRKVLLFSGIAKNYYFRRTVEDMACNIYEVMEFSDHHRYNDDEIELIVSKAQKLKAEYVITTEKDYMRMYQHLPWPVDLIVMGVEIFFENEKAFHKFIKSKLMHIEKKKTV